MNQLDVTYSAIDANKTFTDALKGNFNELITIFHQNFAEVDLSNFNERIKGMEVKKGNKYITKDAIEYDPKKNVLYLNEEKLNTVDAKHELMYAIITMISAYNNTFGIGSNEKLKVLNVGIAEMIATSLVGNDIEDSKGMSKKQIAAQITELMLGCNIEPNDLVREYFSHNDEAFISVLASKSNNSKEMIDALAKASYEIEKDDALSGSSMYGDIQAETIYQMATPENLDFYRTQAIFNEEIVGGTCPDLEAAGMIISNIEQNSKGFEKTKAA